MHQFVSPLTTNKPGIDAKCRDISWAPCKKLILFIKFTFANFSHQIFPENLQVQNRRLFGLKTRKTPMKRKYRFTTDSSKESNTSSPTKHRNPNVAFGIETVVPGVKKGLFPRFEFYGSFPGVIYVAGLAGLSLQSAIFRDYFSRGPFGSSLKI